MKDSAASVALNDYTPQPSAKPSDEPVETLRSWYAVFVFSLIMMLDFIDRGIINLLMEPIRRDLQITDTQVSLLIGVAFILFQAAVAIPIARLVDHSRRRLILGVSVALWSGTTILCGLAQNFAQLFAARMGVGAGEAANGPAIYSMLSDLFPKHRLPRAIGVMLFGFATGQGLALLVGGFVFRWLSSIEPFSFPGLGPLSPWQMTFFVVGLPGLALALLLMTVREPERHGQVRRVMGTRSKGLPVAEVAAFIHANGRAYYPLFLGLGVKTMLSFGFAGWLPTFFIRTFGWNPARIGMVLGVIMLAVVPTALFLGGRLAEFWAHRGRDDANMRVVVIATWLSIPVAIALPLASNAWVAVGFVVLFYLFAMLVPGPQNAALQVITPNEMRAQVMAVAQLVFNIIGFGLGPVIVALTTDHIFTDPSELKFSMALVAGITGPVAGITFIYSLRPYADAVRKAKSWG